MYEGMVFAVKLCVVGCGLMGGSLLMALKGKGYEIWAVDTDDRVLKDVKEQELADKYALTPRDAMAWADLVVLCTMPEAASGIVADPACRFKTGAVVTDFCGVKRPIMSAMKKYLPSGVTYVGAHPMAGREQGTFAHAIAELYQDANVLLTPADGASPDAVGRVSALLKSAGCGEITLCGAEKHDEMIAFTSQLMHIMAASVANHPLYPRSMGYEGGSLRDFTRVATLNPEMWGTLCMSNGTALVPVLKDYIQQLELFLRKLEQTDAAGLKKVFKTANDAKESWTQASKNSVVQL